MNDTKLPFFVRYLEGQEPASLDVQTDVKAGGEVITLKYPSDKDDNPCTMKYPSDTDEV
jgi:hypothetical protein